MERLHVILDLDETLIHSRHLPFEGVDHDFVIDPEGSHYYTHIRPGAPEFIRSLIESPKFEVGVYTASTEDYADVVLDHLFGEDKAKLTGVLARRRTTLRLPGVDFMGAGGWDVGLAEPGSGYREKDLKKYRRIGKCSRKRVIALDDFPKAWKKSYGNLLSIPPFERPEPDNIVLKAAFMALEKLSLHPDVRPVEKRGLILSMVNRIEKNCTQDFHI